MEKKLADLIDDAKVSLNDLLETHVKTFSLVSPKRLAKKYSEAETANRTKNNINKTLFISMSLYTNILEGIARFGAAFERCA